MKRLVMVLALVLVCGSGSLFAQDVPKVEGFIGGAVSNIKADDGDFKLTPLGWTASVAGNLSNVVGIVGEVGGGYRKTGGVSVKIHNFLGGVQFTRRAEKVSGFAQFKAGFAHFSGGGDSENNLQLGFAGGVDYNINDRVAFRIFQFDWLPTRVESGGTSHEWVKNYTRGSIGIVIKGAAR